MQSINFHHFLSFCNDNAQTEAEKLFVQNVGKCESLRQLKHGVMAFNHPVVTGAFDGLMGRYFKAFLKESK